MLINFSDFIWLLVEDDDDDDDIIKTITSIYIAL